MKKEREEVLQEPEPRIPCSLWRRPWWSRYFPVACGKTMLEQISTLQSVEENVLEQVVTV